MAWIESHQAIGSHPKTRKAARILGVPRAVVVGHLHMLWHWALDMAEDGDLSKFDAEDIAIAADWEGDPDEFLTALLDCGPGDSAGFIERDGVCGNPEDDQLAPLVLHDWWDYAGKLIDLRRKDRERKAKARSNGGPSDVQGTSSGSPDDSPPDSRLVGKEVGSVGSKRKKSRASGEDDPKFCEFWEHSYPRKDGMLGGGTSRKEAWRCWQRIPADQHDAVLVGAKFYADYVKQPGAPHVAMATTWLNQERWEQYQEPRFVQSRDGPSRRSPSEPPPRDADYLEGWTGKVVGQ